MAILLNALSILDGGLGVTQPGGRPVAVIGCCASGDGTPTLCYTPEQLVDAGGYGPATEDATTILALAGGPVYLVRAATATAAVLGGYCATGAGSASHGTISADGGNTSTAVLALGGTAVEASPVVIIVTHAGSNLAASPRIKLSFDGGVTFLAEQTAVAGPTTISNGLTLTITDGTFVLGDSFAAVGATSTTRGAPTGSSVPTFSGTPLCAFSMQVKTVTAAASLTALTAAIQVSLDDGRSWGAPVGIPTNGAYVIPNTGVTVTFAAGTFVVGDMWFLKTAPPKFDASSLTDALGALASIAGNYEFAHLAGDIDRTHAAAVVTWGTARAAAGEYVFAVGGVRDQATGEGRTTWMTAIGGATPGFSGFDGMQFLDAHASHGFLASALYPGSYFRRNGAALLSARLASISVDEHPGRVKSGPIAGLMPTTDAPTVVQDGLDMPTLDSYRFSVMQSVRGQPRGRYFFTSRTMAGPTSDFGEVQRIRVMCVAATAALAEMSTQIGSDPEVKGDGSGQLTEGEASAIDAEVSAAIRRAVVDAPHNFATRASAHIDRTVDVLSTGELKAAISIVPKGSVNAVTTTITYARSA